MSNYDQYNTTQPKVVKRNPDTWAKHKREYWLQIMLPLIISLLVVLIFAVLVIVVGTNGEVSQWANVSLIWLIAPMLFFSLIGLALLIGLAYGIFRLLQVLPFYTSRLQDFLQRVNQQVSQVCDRLVEPVIKVKKRSASIKALRHNLRFDKNNQP